MKGKKLPVSRASLPRTLTLVVALLLTVAATGVFAREFRAADTQNEDYPTVQALRYMGHLIEERSGGRLQIRVFHSHQLGEEKETIEQTRVGAIDLNRTNVALIGTFVPSMNVLAMPFLFRSIEHQQKVLDGPIGAEILGSFEPYGFVGLTFYDSGARSFYNEVRPVRTLADMKGLRIRVQQSELMSNMIKALGAEPIELPYGQVLTGLATRLVDGAENNWPSFITTDHYKYAHFYTLTEHNFSPLACYFSDATFKKMDAKLRDAFLDVAKKAAVDTRTHGLAVEKEALALLKEKGVTVSECDKDAFRKRVQPQYETFVKNRPESKPIIDAIRGTKV